MNTIQQHDFAGILGGKNYGKLLKAIPHLPQFEDTIATCAAESVRDITSPTILDMGCGEGMTTLALCKHVRGATIIGLDVADKMLQEYASVADHPIVTQSDNKIEVVRGDAFNFLAQCDPCNFDAVISGFMLHNIAKPEREAIMAGVCRALRPGHRFVNGDKVAHDDESAHLHAIMEQYGLFVDANRASADNAYWLEWIEHYVRDNRPGTKLTERELVSTLKAVGFDSVKLVARMRMEAVVIADKHPSVPEL